MRHVRIRHVVAIEIAGGVKHGCLADSFEEMGVNRKLVLVMMSAYCWAEHRMTKKSARLHGGETWDRWQWC